MPATDGIHQNEETAAHPRRFGRSSLRAIAAVDVRRPISEGISPPATWVREGLYRRTLIVADAVAATAVALVALPLVAATRPVLAALTAVPIMIALCKALGLYDRDELVLKKTTLDELPALLQVAAAFTFVLWLLHGHLTTEPLQSSDGFLLVASTLALLGLARTAGRRIARALSPVERCLVVGDDAAVAAVTAKVTRPKYNTEVVATLGLDGSQGAAGPPLAVRFRHLLERREVHRAIIAPTAGDGGETLELVRIAKHAGVRVTVVPRMLEVVGSAVEFDHVDGLTMLAVRRFGLTRSSRLAKRAFDLVGSSVMLAVVLPLMGLIALAIRLDSRGPVFFRQTRVGKDNRCFEILKFRTMVAGAEERKDALRHLNEARGLFKIEDDPRMTRVGRMLRRTSLDELPQLINVLKGEMSLVGPRPLVVDEDVLIRGFARHRLHLTPGMTGHWQILGSARIPMEEMVGIDYLYVANWSLWNDLKILLRTVPYVLTRRGM